MEERCELLQTPYRRKQRRLTGTYKQLPANAILKLTCNGSMIDAPAGYKAANRHACVISLLQLRSAISKPYVYLDLNIYTPS
jgi:hypothetical protein